MAVTIHRATSPADCREASALVQAYRDYVVEVGMTACLTGSIERDCADILAAYPAEAGGYFLACDEAGAVLGGYGMERYAPGVGEIRRVYVKAQARGRGMGEEMMRHAIAEGRRLGYSKILLDTFRQPDYALKLYRRLGFAETRPFNELPPELTVFLEMKL